MYISVDNAEGFGNHCTMEFVTTNWSRYLHPSLKSTATSLYKFGFILLLSFSCLAQTDSTMCNPDSALQIRDKFQNSELVVRGKIMEIGGNSGNTFIVKVINVYKGDNSYEGENVNILNIPSSGPDGLLYPSAESPVCMSSATLRQKYILYLERQSPNADSGYYLIYQGDLATKSASRAMRQLEEELVTENNEYFTTMAMDTQSDADHYSPCSAHAQAYYCQHGGTCIHIIELDQDSCECPDQYWGKRCELFMYQTGPEKNEDPAPFVILGCMFAFILFLCVIVVVLYLKKGKTVKGSSRFSGDVESNDQETLSIDSNQNTKTQEQTQQEGNDTTKPNSISYNKMEDVGAEKYEVCETSPLTSDCHTTSSPVSSGTLNSKESTV